MEKIKVIKIGYDWFAISNEIEARYLIHALSDLQPVEWKNEKYFIENRTVKIELETVPADQLIEATYEEYQKSLTQDEGDPNGSAEETTTETDEAPF